MVAPTSSSENVKIGVCLVTFNGIDLGFTKGGVEVTVETETHPVQVDQRGNTPINEYLMGRTVKVKVPLAETTLANLVATMPGAVLVVDGTDPTKTRVDVPTGIGQDLLSTAKMLVLHPKGKPLTDKSEDFVVHRAATPGALTFAYKLDDERIFNVEFSGYPTDDEQELLFSFGDPDADATV